MLLTEQSWAYRRAVDRVMTICPQKTEEERRNHAEWIVDGIIDASREATIDSMITAVREN